MNGFKTIISSFILLLLVGCVEQQFATTTECGPNEKFDAINRVCASTIVFKQPPKGTLNEVQINEDSAANTVSLTYSDIDEDLATSCSIIAFDDGVDDTPPGACSCSGGICTTTITPDPDFFGYTGFTYTVTDTHGVSSAKTVSVAVANINDAPTATDGTFSAIEDVPTATNALVLRMPLITYVNDIDLDTFEFSVTQPANGTVTGLNTSTGDYTYTSNQDFNGVDTFTYKACDSGTPTLCTGVKTITVTVAASDDAPTLIPAATLSAIDEDVTSSLNFSLNTHFEDVDSFKADINSCDVAAPVNLTLGACSCDVNTGICTVSNVQSTSDFFGSGSLDFRVTIGGKTTSYSTFPVTINAKNDAPNFVINTAPVTFANDGSTPYIIESATVLTTADEGGAVTTSYESSQSLSLNVNWTYPSVSSYSTISRAEVLYDGNLLDTLTPSDMSALSIEELVITPTASAAGLNQFIIDDTGTGAVSIILAGTTFSITYDKSTTTFDALVAALNADATFSTFYTASHTASSGTDLVDIFPISAPGISNSYAVGAYSSTTKISLGDGATSFDKDKLQVKFYGASGASGTAYIILKLSDDDATNPLTTTSPALAVTFTSSNSDPLISTSSSTIKSNEGGTTLSSAITIDEGGITENAQEIYITVLSSNSTILPDSNINIYSKHKDETNMIFRGLGGATAVHIPANYSVGGTVDTDHRNYRVYVEIDPVAGQVGTGNIFTLTAYDGIVGAPTTLSSSQQFSFDIYSVGATHNGWTKVQAKNYKTDRSGNQVGATHALAVELGWEVFDVAASSADGVSTTTNATIVGHHVYRRKAGEQYDLESPITCSGFSDSLVTSTSCSDTTVAADQVYFYLVKPVVVRVDGSNSLNLDVSTEETYSEVRVLTPRENMVFIHRWMVNLEVCGKMFMDAGHADPTKRPDSLNNFRCTYSGPGETYDAVDMATYYDIGYDLIVDTMEAGCNYAAAPKCSSNGCIGVAAPTSTTGVVNGDAYYDRSTATCYQYNGAWTKVESIAVGAFLPTFADNTLKSLLPPVVNISQEQAHSLCDSRTNLSLPVGSGVASNLEYRLPTRKEQIGYSAWDSVTEASFQTVNNLEQGQSISVTSRCNSSSASGLEVGYSDVDVPPSTYAFSVPGTNSSGIRSVHTGSEPSLSFAMTESCQSRYGVQDVYGNVSEWVMDRFTCDDSTYLYAPYSCVALTESVSGFINGAITYDTHLAANGAPNDSEDNYYVLNDTSFGAAVAATATENTYVFDGVRGPCNDSINAGDGQCDSPMTDWAFGAPAYSASKFIFPVGMIAKDTFTTNFPMSDVIDFLLSIGESTGIETNDLHSDHFTLNSNIIYSSAKRSAGLATGGSYLSGTKAGRYDVEFVPTVSTSAKSSVSLGSTYSTNLLKVVQKHFVEASLTATGFVAPQTVAATLFVHSIAPLDDSYTFDFVVATPGAITSPSISLSGTNFTITYYNDSAGPGIPGSTIQEIIDVAAAYGPFSSRFILSSDTAGTVAFEPNVVAITDTPAVTTGLVFEPASPTFGRAVTVQIVDNGTVSGDNAVVSDSAVAFDLGRSIVVRIDNNVTQASTIASAILADPIASQYITATAAAGTVMHSTSSFTLDPSLTFVPLNPLDEGERTHIQLLNTGVAGISVVSAIPPLPAAQVCIRTIIIDAKDTTEVASLLTGTTVPGIDYDCVGGFDTPGAVTLTDSTYGLISIAESGVNTPIVARAAEPLYSTISFSSKESTGSQVKVAFVQDVAANAETVNVDPTTKEITVHIGPETSSLAIVSLIQNNNDAKTLVSATLNNPAEEIARASTTTSVGDIFIEANSTGTEFNQFSIEFEDSAVAGSETITVTGYSIVVGIQSGSSTAAMIASAINTDPASSALITATALPGQEFRYQHARDPINLSGGIQDVPILRDDIGFRCMIPVKDSDYDAYDSTLDMYDYTP